jgi:AsmA family protein
MRRGLIGTGAVLVAVIVAAAALVTALDAGYCRGALIRYLSLRMGRQIQVTGAFNVHLFSLHPWVMAERVAIGNPRWMPAGLTAEIGKLSLVMELPGFHHSFGIVSLDMQATTLYLVRDSKGYANWQWTAPNQGSGPLMPIVRSLSMSNARVVLGDSRRHLQFEGTVSARDVSTPEGLHPLRIEGTGQLNGRAASFEITGDPLATASHQSPYHFVFAERSSGSRLDGHGYLSRPFDFDLLDGSFEAAGADLKDLYFLTGVALIDTGSYRLAGQFSRRGNNTQFSDVVAASGQSDMRGTVSIDSSSDRPKLDLELNSDLLHLADLGARAAGRASALETSTPLLLSDATLNPDTVRRGDAVVNFHARRVDVGRVPLQATSVKMTINDGVLNAAPLLADLFGGKLSVRLKLDATKEVPAAQVDLKITDLQLDQIDRKAAGQPPLEGPLQARVTITGEGSSVHQVAASANGIVTAVVPHGAIRSSLAELTGIDLRGLGLLLTKSKQESAVRCAIAIFKAHKGILTAESLIADTDPVLITGEGHVNLDTEALDLEVRGHPKSLRLFRLHSPVMLQGTLSHPHIDIQGQHSVLTLVDPGRAKDADCTALLAAASR